MIVAVTIQRETRRYAPTNQILCPLRYGGSATNIRFWAFDAARAQYVGMWPLRRRYRQFT